MAPAAFAVFAAVLSLQAVQLPRDTPARDTPSPKTGTGVIRGLVTDRETGLPLARFVVHLMGSNLEPTAGRRPDPPVDAVTDQRGRFQFRQLPAGRYLVMVESPENRSTHLRQMFGDPQPLSPLRGSKRVYVDVKDGEVREAVNFALWRSLAINGRVIDEFGEPMSNVEVMANPVGGPENMSFGPMRMTDDRGAFRLFGLSPGDYRVCARPQNFGSRRDERERPVRTCYPSAVIDSDAQAVTVSSTDVGEIEIRVQRSRAFTVSGIVVDANGASVSPVNVSLVRSDRTGGFSSGVETTPDGRFIARGVIPGEYAVRAEVGDVFNPSDRREREVGYLPVRVENADVDGLVVVLAKMTKVAGRIVFEDGMPPGRPAASLSVTVRFDRDSVRMMNGPMPTARVNDDLTFELTGLIGPQTIAVNGLPPGWMLKAVRYNNVDVTDTAVEFKSSSDPRLFEIIVSNRGAILSGRVLDDNGNLVPSAPILLVSADPAKWKSNQAVVVSRDDGTFRFRPSRAGDYLVLAIDPEGSANAVLMDPDVLGTVSKLAERVTLLENEQRAIDLHPVKVR